LVWSRQDKTQSTKQQHPHTHTPLSLSLPPPLPFPFLPLQKQHPLIQHYQCLFVSTPVNGMNTRFSQKNAPKPFVSVKDHTQKIATQGSVCFTFFPHYSLHQSFPTPPAIFASISSFIHPRPRPRPPNDLFTKISCGNALPLMQGLAPTFSSEILVPGSTMTLVSWMFLFGPALPGG
jgi:hypothetical protein